MAQSISLPRHGGHLFTSTPIKTFPFPKKPHCHTATKTARCLCAHSSSEPPRKEVTQSKARKKEWRQGCSSESSDVSSTFVATERPLEITDITHPSRRAVIFTGVTGLAALNLPEAAMAAPGFFERGMSKYVKKKKLDPLEIYVPTVLLSVAQIDRVKAFIEDPDSDKDAILNARFLLRTGPTASLRTDLRAIAQYAEESDGSTSSTVLRDYTESGLTPKEDAEKCLQALSDLDTYMKLEPKTGGEKMLSALADARQRLDRLLATVPEDVMGKARAVVGAVSSPSPPVSQGRDQDEVTQADLEEQISQEGESESVPEDNKEVETEGDEGEPELSEQVDLPLSIQKRRKSEVQLLESIL